jgi:8-hydroxy-5-deazaflavin:NADPH oxidoreductase
MNIGVLGAGRLSGALAPHWIAAGHDVMIGGRTPDKTRALADRLGAHAGTLREAAEFGEVVLLAVLYAGIESTVHEAGAADGTLRDKVLIDCNNPVDVKRFLLLTDPGTSLAEQLAAETGARVVKALNQVHFHVWEPRAAYDGHPLVSPIAGDDEDAKALVAELVRDAGSEPLDAGPLEQARNLEAMAAVIVRVLYTGGAPLSAFQLTVGEPQDLSG